MVCMWVWGSTNGKTQNQVGLIQIWEYMRLILGWAEYNQRFILISILKTMYCQLYKKKVTMLFKLWRYCNILIMDHLVIMSAISLVFPVSSENLTNLNSLLIKHIGEELKLSLILFMLMLLRMSLKVLISGMGLIISIFMEEKLEFMLNGTVDCSITQNMKFKDFCSQILGFGLNNITQMDSGLMELPLFCTNIMESIMGSQVFMR